MFRHHRGLDLTRFDPDNDIEISGIRVRSRGEEGIRDMPGNRYELLRRPGRLRNMRYRRRGAGGKGNRKVHKQLFFGDASGVTDMTIEDRPTEDHDILGFKHEVTEGDHETLHKRLRGYNELKQHKSQEKRDFKDHDENGKEKRSLKLNIIDDKDIVKGIRRNKETNSIIVTLRKDKEGALKRQTERAVNEEELSKYSGHLNDERGEWINVERRMMQKEIESALRPHVKHRPFVAALEDQQAADISNGETIPGKDYSNKLHSDDEARGIKTVFGQEVEEQNEGQTPRIKHDDHTPHSKSEDDNLTETFDSLRLLANSRSNVPSVVNDLIKNEKQKDTSDSKDFRNFEVDSAKKIQDNGQIINSRRDNNHTEHVNSLEEVSSPTSALEQIALSTTDIPTTTQSTSGLLPVLPDKISKVQSNSGTPSQEGQFQVKESEDMVHAKDKDDAQSSKRSAIGNGVFKRDNDAFIQDAVLDIEKIDVDEMPGVLQQKLTNSHGNVNRELRKEKDALADYYNSDNQNQESRYFQGNKNTAQHSAADGDYRLSELYEKHPDMDSGDYDDYGGDSYKRKRDTNILYEENYYNTARKLMYLEEKIDDNSVGDSTDVQYVYDDDMDKRSEGDEEEEEGDPYVGKKAGYDLSKKVNQNVFSDTILKARSEDEYNAEQKGDSELDDAVASDAPEPEPKNAEKQMSDQDSHQESKNSTDSHESTSQIPECPPSETTPVIMAGDFEVNTQPGGKDNPTTEEANSTEGSPTNETQSTNTTSAAEPGVTGNSLRIYDNREFVAQRYLDKQQHAQGNSLVDIVKSDNEGTYNSVLNSNHGSEHYPDGPIDASFAHHSGFHAHHHSQKQHTFPNDVVSNISYHRKNVGLHSNPGWSPNDIREDTSGPLISTEFRKNDQYDARFQRMQKRTNKNIRNLKDRFHSEEYEEPLMFVSKPNIRDLSYRNGESRRVKRQKKRSPYNARDISPLSDYQTGFANPRNRRYANDPDMYLRKHRSWNTKTMKKKTVDNNIQSYEGELQQSLTNTRANEKQKQDSSKALKRYNNKKEAINEWADAGANTKKNGTNKCFLTAEKGLNPNPEHKSNAGGVSINCIYS